MYMSAAACCCRDACASYACHNPTSSITPSSSLASTKCSSSSSCPLEIPELGADRSSTSTSTTEDLLPAFHQLCYCCCCFATQHEIDRACLRMSCPLENFFTQMLLLWLFFNGCPALLVLVLLVLVLVLCLFLCLCVCVCK